MVFLNPSFLWALLGLSIPLAIHLWSRKQGKTIKVGSIKYLQDSDSKRSRSIKLNELWLLLLRMLLITILVFIMSEPRWNYKTENTPITYLVEPSLLDSPKSIRLFDSLALKYEVRFLHSEFPVYDSKFSEAKHLETPYYWQLAREMQSLKTDSIVVFTNAFLTGVKGKRPEIDKNIYWVSLNSDESKTNLVGTLKSENEVEIISAISDVEVFKFEKEIQNITPESRDSILEIEKDTLKVKMYSEDKFKTESKYLKASFLAISKYLSHPIKIQNIKKEDSLKLTSNNLLVWLSGDSVPKTEAKVLKFQKNIFSNSLIEAGDFKNEYVLTASLNSENSIEQHLGGQLIKLIDFYPELEKGSEIFDRRVMNLELFKPNFKEGLKSNSKQERKEFSNLLWLFFVLLLISERVLSRYRMQ